MIALVLTGELHGRKISVEIPAESDIHEFLDACGVIAIGLTYNANSWMNAITEAAETIKDNAKREEW